MKYLFLLSVTGFLVVSPAAAQSRGAATFEGPWVAAMGGYDGITSQSAQDDAIDPDIDESIDGFVYGFAAGYDKDLGKLVLGIEGELSDSTAESDEDNGFADFGLGEVAAGRDLYLGARIGVKVTPATLIYAKAGYSNARFNYVAGNDDGDEDYRVNLDTDGYRVGFGVEQKLGPNAFAKAEYRYSNYSEGEIDFEAEGVPDGNTFATDTDRHQVMLGVGYRF